MSAFEVKVPRLAESISEAVLVQWLKQEGEPVRVDEAIATLETDKAAVEIPAERAGVLHHGRKVGETVSVGDVIARIDESAGNGGAPAATGEPGGGVATPEAPAEASRPAGSPAGPVSPTPAPQTPAPRAPAPLSPAASGEGEPPLSPSVRRLVGEHALDPSQIPTSGRGGRLLKEDVERYLRERAAGGAPGSVGSAPSNAPASAPAPVPGRPTAPAPPATASSTQSPTPAPSAGAAASVRPGTPGAEWNEDEEERAVPMSRIRQRIAERLVQAQQTAAILTTFNEIDMTAVMELRAKHKEAFEKRHGVRLSFMSFFARACMVGLERIPEINAEIRGTDIVYHRHVHLGVAVGTDRGLVVPVVRNADRLGFAALEREIARMAALARDNRLQLQDLQGGTFSVSNGGVYGSLLSTPILNPPQSGILGMHKIEKRPIVVGDAIVVRPMMYVALSYDHRIVDGEQAVTFLVTVKEQLEDPERMLLEV
jgi:2-oxoglutarate dehydrogenase E2 component (dihydrolipoamide succinyltransferase)